jgi:uroporphyrinogen decarboxylase
MMMDFYDNPRFVKELLHTIAAYNIAHLSEAMQIYRRRIFRRRLGTAEGSADVPRSLAGVHLSRAQTDARSGKKGRQVHIHPLLDGPVQRRGRLSFYGGLSTQKPLPYGRVEDVWAETVQLLEHGCQGGFILSPAHDVEGDVALENTLAFIETAQEQLQP